MRTHPNARLTGLRHERSTIRRIDKVLTALLSIIGQ
jgi:hypothetical protein